MKTENLVMRCSEEEKLQIQKQMKLRGISSVAQYFLCLVALDGLKLKNEFGNVVDVVDVM